MRRPLLFPSRRLWVLLAVIGLLVSACADPVAVDFPEDTIAESGDSSGSSPGPDPECNAENPRPSFAPREGDEALATDRSEFDAIKEDGKLTVGVPQDTLLFGYLNPESGNIEGFEIEIARLVAEALLGDKNAIELVPIRSSERIPKLESGELEMVIKTMTINCERWSQVNFSSVYYEAGQGLLVGVDSGINSFADLTSEHRVCAEEGTTSIERIAELGVTVVGVKSNAQCLVSLQRGESDAISTDDTILAGLAEQDPFVKVIDEIISEEPYGIATAKDDVEFTRFINAVLEQIRSGGSAEGESDDGESDEGASSAWQRLYDEWLASAFDDPETPEVETKDVPQAEYR